MLNWKEYIDKIHMIIYRCKFCRSVFDTEDDVKVHIAKNHEIEVNIEQCKSCKQPFIKVLDKQVICGRQSCMFRDAFDKSEVKK